MQISFRVWDCDRVRDAVIARIVLYRRGNLPKMRERERESKQNGSMYSIWNIVCALHIRRRNRNKNSNTHTQTH